jgi:co-chaperonin GroES (HSP10)
MRRREFITLIGGAAAWPLAASAQQAERMRRVGVLIPLAAEDSEAQGRVAAIEHGLRQSGWTMGQNLQIDYRFGGGNPDRMRTLLRLSRSFDWVQADGVVDAGPGEQPEYLRRHAVIAVGHGEIKGQRAVLVRNSWGDSWGDGGYGWLTEKFLLPRVFRLAILKEDLSVSRRTAAA